VPLAQLGRQAHQVVAVPHFGLALLIMGLSVTAQQMTRLPFSLQSTLSARLAVQLSFLMGSGAESLPI